MERVAKHCSGLPGEIVELSSLEEPERHRDMFSGGLIGWAMVGLDGVEGPLQPEWFCEGR